MFKIDYSAGHVKGHVQPRGVPHAVFSDQRLDCCDRWVILFRSTRVNKFVLKHSATVSAAMGRDRFEASKVKLRALGYLSSTATDDALRLPDGPCIHIPRSLFEHGLTAEAVDLWQAMRRRGPLYMRELEAHLGLKRKAVGRHFGLLANVGLAHMEERRAGGRFAGDVYRIGPATAKQAAVTAGPFSGRTAGPSTAGPKSGPLLKRSPYDTKTSSSNTSRIAAREGKEEVENVQEKVCRPAPLTLTEIVEAKAAIQAFNALKTQVEPCPTPDAFTRTVALRLRQIGGIEAWHRALGAIHLDELLSGKLAERSGRKFRLTLMGMLSTDSNLGDVLVRLLSKAAEQAAKRATWPWWLKPEEIEKISHEEWESRLLTHAGRELSLDLFGPAPVNYSRRGLHQIIPDVLCRKYELYNAYDEMGRLHWGCVAPNGAGVNAAAATGR